MSHYNRNSYPTATAAISAQEVAQSRSRNRPYKGRWYIDCPAHGGDGMNLSIWDGPDGIGARCHSQRCSYADIMRTLGVQSNGLRERKPHQYEARLMATYKHVDGTPRQSWRADYPEDWNMDGPCSYGAQTTNPCKKGTEPHKHVFTRPIGLPRKGSLPRLWTLDKPENLLVIVEGEPAAGQLAHYVSMGQLREITPVSYFGGGGAAPDTLWGDLMTDRQVVIWPDPDSVGDKALGDLVAIAHETGAAQVLVVQVDGLSGVDGEKGKDAADLGAEECQLRIQAATAPPPGSVTESASASSDGDALPRISHRKLAQEFADDWGEKYNYDERNKVWRLYDGIAWQEAGLELLNDIGLLIEDVLRRERISDSKWLSLTTHKGVKGLAEALLAEEFDTNPHLLALPNGDILEVQTGKTRELKREDRITRYLPEAVMNRSEENRKEWEEFLWQGLDHYEQDDRTKIIAFLQQWSGTALAGDCRDEAMIFLYGRPRTGKSTFAGILLDLFGSYGAVLAGRRVVGNKDGGHLQWLAKLAGKRLVWIDEVPDNGRWQPAVMNQLVSGLEIEANRMRENSIAFTSVAHVIATGNHRPQARAASGLWRRIHIVQFQHQVAEDAQDKELRKRLVTNLGDIYDWALEGLRLWIADGRNLKVPKALLQETKDYQRSADPVTAFVEECIDASNPETYIRFSQLYGIFEDWWKHHAGGKLPSMQSFSSALDDLGFPPTRHKKVERKSIRVRHGLQLKDQGLIG